MEKNKQVVLHSKEKVNSLGIGTTTLDELAIANKDNWQFIVIWVKFEYIRITYTKMDTFTFYNHIKSEYQKVLIKRKIKNFLKRSSQSTFILLGVINPLYGLIGEAVVGIIADERFKRGFKERIIKNWQNMSVNQRRMLILATSVGIGTAAVLITTILFPVESMKGGLPSQAFTDPRTNFFRFKHEIREPLAIGFCDHVWNYSRNFRYTADFVPKNPWTVDYGLINEAIFKISKMIANNQKLEIDQTTLYFLISMCSKSSFR